MVDIIGLELGNYRLTKRIGSGGFAEVYTAEHVVLRQDPVAIKVLQGSWDEEQARKFATEAQLLRDLKHPNIVPLLDVGLKPMPYLVMPYAANGTLRHRHPRGHQVSLEQVVKYAKQIAAALQYAHDEKFIHRDVKPENILLMGDGSLLLSDFGIVAVMHSSLSMRTEGYIGTALYSAPEQFGGKSVAATDQYALGVMTYELLCGDVPFHGSDLMHMMYLHCNETPPSLHTCVPTISLAIEAVVMRALSKKAGDRYPSVEEFAQALEEMFLQEKASPVPAPPDNVLITTSTIPGVHQPVQVMLQPTVPAQPNNNLARNSVWKRDIKSSLETVSVLLQFLSALLAGLVVFFWRDAQQLVGEVIGQPNNALAHVVEAVAVGDVLLYLWGLFYVYFNMGDKTSTVKRHDEQEGQESCLSQVPLYHLVGLGMNVLFCWVNFLVMGALFEGANDCEANCQNAFNASVGSTVLVCLAQIGAMLIIMAIFWLIAWCIKVIALPKSKKI